MIPLCLVDPASPWHPVRALASMAPSIAIALRVLLQLFEPPGSTIVFEWEWRSRDPCMNHEVTLNNMESTGLHLYNHLFSALSLLLLTSFFIQRVKWNAEIWTSKIRKVPKSEQMVVRILARSVSNVRALKFLGCQFRSFNQYFWSFNRLRLIF